MGPVIHPSIGLATVPVYGYGHIDYGTQPFPGTRFHRYGYGFAPYPCM